MLPPALATAWLASNLDKKLSKSQLIHTDIPETARVIMETEDVTFHETPDAVLKPIALRISGQLLYGVVRIYARQEKYLLDDAGQVLLKLKTVFKANNGRSIILPAQKTMANVSRLMLQDTVAETNISSILQQKPLELADWDGDTGSQLLRPLESQQASFGDEGGSVAGDSVDFGDVSLETGRDRQGLLDITNALGDITKHPGQHESVLGPQEEEHLDLGEEDLILDFGDDLAQENVPHDHDQNQDVEEGVQELEHPEFDEFPETVEEGRDMPGAMTDHDITLGRGIPGGDITALLDKQGSDAVLETVAEEQAVFEQPRASRRRRAQSSRTSRVVKERKKRVVWDDVVEIAEFRDEPTHRGETRQKIDEAVEEQRKLFYIKKCSNPAYFALLDRFSSLWDLHRAKGEVQVQSSLNQQAVQNFEDVPLELDVGEIRSLDEEQDHHEEHHEEPDTFDYHFDEPDLGEVHEEPQLEQDEADIQMENETFEDAPESPSYALQPTLNEFASSLAESRHSEAPEDQEVFSQVGSQYEEVEDTVNPNAVSKNTLKIAEILKNEFLEDQGKEVQFDQLVEKDFGRDDALSSNIRRERVRCFFELLVLATKDAVSLKQEGEVFGNILVGFRNGIFERF